MTEPSNAHQYHVNEIFYSVQGEGAMAGTPMAFVRFAHCNLTCKAEEQGFDCDTEFAASTPMTAETIRVAVMQAIGTDALLRYRPAHVRPWVLLTGGEPTLQIDKELLVALCQPADGGLRFRLALETNGTKPIPEFGLFSWVTVSPKTAEHTLRAQSAHELRYVRAFGQAIPRPSVPLVRFPFVMSEERYISPAWVAGNPAETRRNAQWCLDLVKRHPVWRLSIQAHKLWGAR